MSPAEYCKSCPYFLNDHGACIFPDRSAIWACITLATIIIPFFFSIKLLFSRRLYHLKPFIYMNLACIVSDLGIKPLLNDPRPEGACKHGPGMPSSHMAEMGIFLMLRLIYSPYLWQKAFWVFFTGLVGISRIELNYHYPSQAAIGALIGALFFFVCQFGWSLVDSAIPNLDVKEETTELTDEIDAKKMTSK